MQTFTKAPGRTLSGKASRNWIRKHGTHQVQPTTYQRKSAGSSVRTVSGGSFSGR